MILNRSFKFSYPIKSLISILHNNKNSNFTFTFTLRNKIALTINEIEKYLSLPINYTRQCVSVIYA